MAAQVPHESEEEILPKSCTDFISTLPAREGWSQPLYLYKNYWFRPQILEMIMRVPDVFKPRHDDVILATQPKCGTTLLKALTFAITNRSRYSFIDHPLLTQNPHHLVPFIEIPIEGRDITYTETLPSPRLLSTHLPLSLVPPETASCGSRIIYLCREPKDVIVSRWHFFQKMFDMNIGQERAATMFLEGFSPYGPFWDHYLEYWKESLVRPDHVLFLRYEELVLDPENVVRKIADFIGMPLTEEENRNGVVKEVVKLCSFEALASLEVNQKGGINHANLICLKNSLFFRKGNVGDWVNHMSEDMGREIDIIVKDKFRGSGLTF